MKQYEVLGHCPICYKRLLVTQLTCQGCKTQINGQYTLNEFCYLDKELLNFAIVFIKNRGNVNLESLIQPLDECLIKQFKD